MLATAGASPFILYSSSLIISFIILSVFFADKQDSRNCPKIILFLSFSYMSGILNLVFQKNGWAAPLKTCFCSVMQDNTNSNGEPLKSFPKVPF
ncbi:MAG: hypothetical protein LKE46_00605 [Clostridium sp.]|jgi:hypothetical protein|uniref:hypothetical protein n=1 Tax=Clostridium sp. TaxID=1506 RepID=UPI0025C57AEA|nr:hypothetical protein [Clostridium sp.]MCH3962754.1 hypothetical protein [Clostridium sp.]MCI1715831.1 hypothetical protein [Clostridium sp.]MCI1799964.1 hypothetical protein [Clostridium sp.]MCI1813878.1 hypothetical protein [Clostridium sp.]MCI1870776.1 hypothetical protein [Clostridium sp.]